MEEAAEVFQDTSPQVVLSSLFFSLKGEGKVGGREKGEDWGDGSLHKCSP